MLNLDFSIDADDDDTEQLSIEQLAEEANRDNEESEAEEAEEDGTGGSSIEKT